MKSERSKKSHSYVYRTYTVKEYSLECPWCKTTNGGLSSNEVQEGTMRRCSYCGKLIKVMELNML